MYVEKKALQITAFRMEDGNGMVKRLAVAAENLNLSIRFQGGAKQDILEERLVDVIGARAGQKK